MTSAFDEAAVRRWLVDYLVTNNGCSPEHIDRGASMHDLGVGSRDAVVLTGVLSEFLGRTVSPVDFWQYPTVDALAKYLTGGEVEPVGDAADQDRPASMDEPVAVIGLGLRLPGGPDLDGNIEGPDAYWDFLTEGRSSVREVPEDRWSWFDDGTPEGAAALAGTTKWGSFLRDIDAFDAEFFEIIPREATRMDPQQRLLLEVTHEALEHAGIPMDALAESRTGVFAGASAGDYAQLGSTDLSGVDAWYGTGASISIIANRVSYFFDLRGPSVTIDTACSSSLVAIHLATQSLRTGDSDLALAAGVNLLLSPAGTRSLDQAEAMSPTGQCHAFDADADGFVRGEGCGVAVLKRLSDAQRDGDRVLAVIRGSAVNQDGRSNGLMAPNPSAQMAVLRAAYSTAGVSPREVDYVEAHGTGTLLGDPIEARALGTVLGKGRPADAPLLIGAVKSNLGHLEAAAGIAGFAKAVLSLQHNKIPANLDYRNPNPHIPFDKLRLKVVDEHTDWAPAGRPRRAGVSSFGFGGTNAHVVIEQAPVTIPSPAAEAPAVTTLVVSGKTPERIASQAAMVADWMTGPGAEASLSDVAHTLNHHRSQHGAFATVVARDTAQAVAGLRALAAGQSAPGVVGAASGSPKPGTVFVYSGQGSQWAGMARRLLTDEPVFAQALADIEPVFVEQVGFSLRDIITGGEPVSGDAQVQPVLMGLQLALTELWRSYGVHPDAVIGHSMGEVTAAVVAGALTLADGLKVIAQRSAIMSRLAGQGAVALLTLDADAAVAAIADHPSVEIAGHLSPRQTVVAGLPGQVDAVIAAVTAQNTFARRVNMVVASHTALMDPVLPDIRAALADVRPSIPTLPFLSTVTDPASSPVLDADYWVDNVRRPVRFSQAITAAATDHGTFIEVSPHAVLGQPISDTLAGEQGHLTLGTLARDTDDTVTFHANLNATHTSRPPQSPLGAEPHTVLPATPWHRTRHWVDVRPLRRVGGGHAGALPADSIVPPEWFCELTWPVKPLVGAPDPNVDPVEGRWLVIGDDVVAGQLATLLGERSSVTTSPAAAEPVALAEAVTKATHVLYAPPVSDDDELGYRIFETGRVVASAAAASDRGPKLFLLTRNAQPTAEGDRANPAHAVLWGLGRTLALEHPEIWGAVVDIDESVPAVVAARWVSAEAHASDGEDQIVFRAGTRRVARLVHALPPAAAPEAEALDPDGAHLVIGATGNLGPQIIEQLATMGARTVVAVSRNPGTRLDEITARLAPRGTTVVAAAADAADEASLRTLFDRFGTDLPPLAGIYLAAMSGGPVTLAEMTHDDVLAMFRPKMDAAAALHKLSLDHPVQQFVLFSSISGVLGSRWLAHYAATTTYLDTFAYARRAAGLPGCAINWGLWKSLADVQTGFERQATAESGLEPMEDAVAITALRSFVGPQAPARATVVAADWPRLATAYRTRAELHILDDLLNDETVDGSVALSSDTTFRKQLRECEPEQRIDLLADHVSAQVAAAMGRTSAHTMDPTVGFFQFGMDSLMSVTLQRSLSESLGEVLPASVVFDYPTIEALTDYLASILPEIIETAGTDNGVATASNVTEDAYDDLAEDELLARLSERLS
ncbi:Phthiocerol/phenolphthiocerol synthesis polyketide synthase type I PpsB [Mycolicibacterium vanbaalenii]|uniref:Phthiocerol/phenolphthiocerol synthesis polyketide synthase type I PpsB n=1 Tax=Mycolicibacterium vanbaalenii TaxID=110539 RepID=A0A5S9PS15_MYCVN|nr:type I polyketide synthase [Mycolicibacterium vanbaalenii]CAA0107116.1 Phthiocerol/phenolphthiocerol synthesis polyketide synthase type I PpsB [Mycolicibacterium vanbaalenii]